MFKRKIRRKISLLVLVLFLLAVVFSSAFIASFANHICFVHDNVCHTCLLLDISAYFLSMSGLIVSLSVTSIIMMRFLAWMPSIIELLLKRITPTTLKVKLLN